MKPLIKILIFASKNIKLHSLLFEFFAQIVFLRDGFTVFELQVDYVLLQIDNIVFCLALEPLEKVLVLLLQLRQLSFVFSFHCKEFISLISFLQLFLKSLAVFVSNFIDIFWVFLLQKMKVLFRQKLVSEPYFFRGQKFICGDGDFPFIDSLELFHVKHRFLLMSSHILLHGLLNLKFFASDWKIPIFPVFKFIQKMLSLLALSSAKLLSNELNLIEELFF